MTTYTTTHESPVGPLTLTAGEDGALTRLLMQDQRHRGPDDPTWVEDQAPFEAARVQLDEYFAGERTEFALELRPHGTEFQRQVWNALLEIPYGTTSSYGELADRIGNPRAVRAVGLANGRNPIGIIIPCHRVIGADGSLTGYGGGLDRKVALLSLEGALAAPSLPL
jgi:methylated-DNA-[protein]-cysteine S-methyltransferase